MPPKNQVVPPSQVKKALVVVHSSFILISFRCSYAACYLSSAVMNRPCGMKAEGLTQTDLAFLTHIMMVVFLNMSKMSFRRAMYGKDFFKFHRRGKNDNYQNASLRYFFGFMFGVFLYYIKQ